MMMMMVKIVNCRPAALPPVTITLLNVSTGQIPLICGGTTAGIFGHGTHKSCWTYDFEGQTWRESATLSAAPQYSRSSYHKDWGLVFAAGPEFGYGEAKGKALRTEYGLR